MDDLLGEFLNETGENLDLLSLELVRFEQEPNNFEMLNAIFRLVHTIKGTCGFLGLERLAKLTHAAETLMGQYRDGAPVTAEGVSVILACIDRIKEIVAALEREAKEPIGLDADLIGGMERLAEKQKAVVPSSADRHLGRSPVLDEACEPLPGGEVSPAELERAWAEASDPDAAAEAANSLSGAREGASRNQTVRVSVDTLEHLMTTVSELVLTRNQLLDLVRRGGESEFKLPLQRLSNVTAELQEGIMKARMQPIANAWHKLPRLVRELSLSLGKKIELELVGGDTELDRQVLELIKDPLTHMVRNSADHGLETTAERIRAGKPITGRIRLSASQQGGYIVVAVSDDGSGLNTQKIRAKALASGVATQAELSRLSDAELCDYIFRPGFSTASAVTGVSGRGVGMDVVRANIELIGGTVELATSSAAGTTFLIKIPLTLAIMAALIVAAGGQRFAIPQFSVVELVRAGRSSEHQLELINETMVLRLRNRLVPLIDLCHLLKLQEAGSTLERATSDTLTVVLMQIGARVFGLIVEAVFHTDEIVAKPMSSLLREISLFSGNTILGDGTVIMILDPNALGAAVGSFETQSETNPSDVAEAEQEKQSATALLLFRVGTDGLKAVPLSLITRLEEIDTAKIERCNGQEMVQYRGALMPLVYFDQERSSREGDMQTVLVFTEQGRPVGLAVDAIIDIVEEPLNIEIASDAPGVIGAAVVRGKATQIVDVSHYLAKGAPSAFARAEQRSRQGIKVLLVDDSQFFRNMLAPLLAAQGYQVTLAASADEALALKDAGRSFDLIISDLEMPGMDGIALAERIKTDANWRKVPLVALSSYGGKTLIERSRAAGFADHVGKFDRRKLMETLEECCRQWVAAA